MNTSKQYYNNSKKKIQSQVKYNNRLKIYNGSIALDFLFLF